MPIICALISEKNLKKGEYAPSNTQKITEILMTKILPKISQGGSLKTTLVKDDLDIHCKYDSEYRVCYFCVARSNTPHRLCWAFLDAAEEEYMGLTQASYTTIKDMLARLAKHYNDPANDRIASLHSKVEDVKGVMIQNIEKVLDRGEQIQTILEAAEDLEDTAVTFRRGAKKLKWALMARLVVVIILILFIICLVISAAFVFLTIFICGLNFECLPRIASSSPAPSAAQVFADLKQILKF